MNEIAQEGAFIRNISLGYAYLKANKSSNEYMSRYVLDILRHKADLIISHSLWKDFSASWAITFQDREGGYIKYNNSIPETQETPYDPFVQLDLQLNYKHQNWLIFAEATNLLNQINVDYGNVPQPGRWVRMGIKYDVDLKNLKKKS
jgi:iron complex outermembrane receptor protein